MSRGRQKTDNQDGSSLDPDPQVEDAVIIVLDHRGGTIRTRGIEIAPCNNGCEVKPISHSNLDAAIRIFKRVYPHAPNAVLKISVTGSPHSFTDAFTTPRKVEAWRKALRGTGFNPNKVAWMIQIT
jgi:hypothetical protein